MKTPSFSLSQLLVQGLLFAVCLIASAATAGAQIVSVELVDAKVARKYRPHVIERGGKHLLIGEVKAGIEVGGNGFVTYDRGRNELWMPDASKPEVVPYVLKGERRVVKRRRQVLGILGDHVARVSIVLENETLASQAVEYDRRREIVEELESFRDDERRRTVAWFEANARLILGARRLAAWLERNGYTKAAQRAQKDLATLERAQNARPANKPEDHAGHAGHGHAKPVPDSIRMVSTPEELTKISEELTGGSAVFRVQESEHVRVTYLRELSDGEVHDLLMLAERIIADFREEFVAPHVGEGFEDHLPEGLFQEFWFGPVEDELHAAFMERWYGLSWGPHKEQRIQPKGARRRAFKGPKYLDYWRLRVDNDLQGIVAHGLGHSLANLHFNADGRGTPQDWIEEGLGTYISLEHLGQNTVTCKRFRPRGYAREHRLPGSAVAMYGARAYFDDLALDKGSSVAQIAAKELTDLGEGDLAKAWSLIDFTVRELGRDGQLWLREACRSAKSPVGFLESWRAATAKIFPTEAEDPLAELDALWRASRSRAEGDGAVSLHR